MPPSLSASLRIRSCPVSSAAIVSRLPFCVKKGIQPPFPALPHALSVSCCDQNKSILHLPSAEKSSSKKIAHLFPRCHPLSASLRIRQLSRFFCRDCIAASYSAPITCPPLPPGYFPPLLLLGRHRSGVGKLRLMQKSTIDQVVSLC